MHSIEITFTAVNLTSRIRSVLLRWVSQALALTMLSLAPAVGWSTSALQVFNVTDYGALGNGTHDDGPAFQAAINAAIGNGGGLIYFTSGTYLIDSPVSDNSLLSHSIQGSSENGTTLLIGSTGSVTLKSPVAAPYHGGAIHDLTVRCANTSLVGITLNDAIGTNWHNIAFSECSVGLLMRDVQYWSERNDFDDVTFYNCTVAVQFLRQSTDTNSSFGYNNFRIWVNTDQPGTIFRASGGAVPYNSSYSVQGNLARGTIIFDAHSDGHANSMYQNAYFVQVEDQSGGSGTSYVFDDHVASGPNGEIHGMAQLSFGPYTQESAPGSVSVAVSSLQNMAMDLGTLTLSASTSDTMSNLAITPGSSCFVQPANSIAASLAGVWVASVSWNAAVVSHPAAGANGAVVRVWCHP
jgi:hypothetical protein